VGECLAERGVLVSGGKRKRKKSHNMVDDAGGREKKGGGEILARRHALEGKHRETYKICKRVGLAVMGGDFLPKKTSTVGSQGENRCENGGSK